MVGRFAPSTTGPAHPGTLLAALLCWLDARSLGGRVVLRLEDLDPLRCRPEWADAMRRDLAWLGLDWDATQLQSESGEAHAAALDALAAAGLLYPCKCSRRDVRALGRPAPDGGFAYANTCRGRALPAGGWRDSDDALRAVLPDGWVRPRGEDDEALAQRPVLAFGDPVVRRRDGSIAYHLASVVDDARAGVDRVVRGRDLALSTAIQVALHALLGSAAPVYRHHLLLLERRGEKLAKLHGSVDLAALQGRYDAGELCGVLAHACGLRADATVTSPRELLSDFDWTRVARADRVLHWDGVDLVLSDPAAG